MFTPAACLTALRAALAASALGVAFWMLFSPAGGGVPARLIALYALALLASAAFPRVRRDDLAISAVALACAAEALRALRVGHLDPALPLADFTGVCAAWAPAAVEAFRRLGREHPGTTFAELMRSDRRRAPRLREAGQG